MFAVFCVKWTRSDQLTVLSCSVCQSILKKSVTMMQTPSAVYHFNDGAGEKVSSNKVNAIFQAAKKDLLQVIQLQVKPSSCRVMKWFLQKTQVSVHH